MSNVFHVHNNYYISLVWFFDEKVWWKLSATTFTSLVMRPEVNVFTF